jgi:hypothetical protein
MAITNTVGKGRNTVKDGEGDRSGLKICEVVQSFLVMNMLMRQY